jgi:glycosyltransferase involved in cell wall biosynthesis
VAHVVNLMTGTPFSFTAHAKDIYLTPAHLIRERVAAAGFIATCTGYNADFLRALLPQAMCHKVNLVYHGIDLSLFRFRPPPYTFTTTRKPLILCVARLVPKKGLGDLIAACAVLQRAGVCFRCEIVGDGPLRAEIENAISSAGLGEDVALLGSMTHARLIKHLSEADLFALAPCIAEDGDRDGIPNVIVEAMAIGVPVVSSDISGIPEMVMHEKSGLLVPPRDPAALAAAMARVLADPALGRRLARTARARLDRCFNCWENTRELGGLMGRLAREAVPSCQRLSKRREPTGVERVS